MKTTRTTITIKGHMGGEKKVSALLLSPRVAVHVSYMAEGHTISDPRTGSIHSGERFVRKPKHAHELRKFLEAA